MQEKSKSIYLLARKKAAKTKPLLERRESAAELLMVSSQSLQNYESGVTKVPDDIIVRMANLYNTPELRNYYCQQICAIGKIQAHELDIEQLGLDRLSLKLLSSFKEINRIKEDLIEIAADGIITDEEKPALDNILLTLDAIAKNAEALKIWAEREFNKK